MCTVGIRTAISKPTEVAVRQTRSGARKRQTLHTVPQQALDNIASTSGQSAQANNIGVSNSRGVTAIAITLLAPEPI